MRYLACLLMLGAMLLGCDKTDKTDKTGAPAPPASAGPTVTTPVASTSAASASSPLSAQAAAAQDDVDDGEFDLAANDDDDVEQSTTSQIQKSNYKAELDKLEKEDLKK